MCNFARNLLSVWNNTSLTIVLLVEKVSNKLVAIGSPCPSHQHVEMTINSQQWLVETMYYGMSKLLPITMCKLPLRSLIIGQDGECTLHYGANSIMLISLANDYDVQCNDPSNKKYNPPNQKDHMNFQS